MTLITGALLGASLVVACGDDRPTTAEMGAPPSGAGAPGGGGGVAEAGIDAASITARPDLCVGVDLGGGPVEEMRWRQDPQPPIGGEVAEGIYDLVEAGEYAGPSADPNAPVSQSSGRILQGSLVVGEFDLQMTLATSIGDLDGDAGTATTTTQGWLFRTSGAYLVSTRVCPTTAMPVNLAYSASGSGLAIYTDATHIVRYQRRP